MFLMSLDQFFSCDYISYLEGKDTVMFILVFKGSETSIFFSTLVSPDIHAAAILISPQKFCWATKRIIQAMWRIKLLRFIQIWAGKVRMPGARFGGVNWEEFQLVTPKEADMVPCEFRKVPTMLLFEGFWTLHSAPKILVRKVMTIPVVCGFMFGSYPGFCYPGNLLHNLLLYQFLFLMSEFVKHVQSLGGGPHLSLTT